MDAPALPLSAAGLFQPLPSALRGAEDGLALDLMRAGLITGDEMVQALALQSRRNGRIVDILITRNMIDSADLFAFLARKWSADLVDLKTVAPDPRLIRRIGATACLRRQILPLRRCGGVTQIATSRPEEFERQRPQLTRLFGPIAMVVAKPDSIEAAILRHHGPALARAAEARVPAAESCRDLAGDRLLGPALLLGIVLAAGTVIFPILLLWALMLWAVLTLITSMGLKLAAGIAALWQRPATRPADQLPEIARLPIVSVMVPLYREADIAPRLIRRLGQLDYPSELLDIVLVAEADDHLTRSALAAIDLPPWMSVVVVPDGPIKTKPRALNFALDHCRGTIIGVYDAEDAPEASQISRVVERFHSVGPDVACIQGVLDFYNPATNWLSRCFTIEYATWFRVILPGLQRLGLCIPLGGTTLFFRRQVIEDLGGWDAHNVTEDADLGIRLYRHGYRTEILDTVTKEEANCRAIPWVKQRSRWLKGYMMTWACHMRDPGLLLRQLGWWKFTGFQILFLCTLSQFVLLPVLWAIGFIGALVVLPDAAPNHGSFGLAILLLFAVTEIVNITFGVIGLRRSGQKISPLWVPTLTLYFPLGALASYKALWEVLRNPFYWDKTCHGKFDPLVD